MHTSKLLLVPLASLALAGLGQAQEEKPVQPAQPLVKRPAAALTAGGQAKEKTQEELITLRDEKMALPVFKKADWTFDYDKARAEAKKSGKLIFTYFSRSYAH